MIIRWKDLDHTRVRELAEGGASITAISRAMNCQINTIRRLAKYYNITIQSFAAEGSAESVFWETNDARLYELLALGFTRKAIASALGTTKNAVIGRLHRRKQQGDEPEPPKPEPEPLFPPRNGCVFPFGDPGDEGFHFCGEKVFRFGSPYCAPHHTKCHIRRMPIGQAVAEIEKEQCQSVNTTKMPIPGARGGWPTARLGKW